MRNRDFACATSDFDEQVFTGRMAPRFEVEKAIKMLLKLRIPGVRSA